MSSREQEEADDIAFERDLTLPEGGLVSGKCIILTLCDDGKIRAVMEDYDHDPPPGASWPQEAIRVFADANEAFAHAVFANIKMTFQIVELEDME